jgi:hypothetical protein
LSERRRKNRAMIAPERAKDDGFAGGEAVEGEPPR